MTRQLLNWTITLALIVGFSSCNGQVEKDLSTEKVSESELLPVGETRLVKTQGSRDGDNVHCSLQDNAGNLWFGTTGEGVYKYDGKLFQQFTATDGLYSNTVWCIFEDKDGKIWVGTDAGVSWYDGKAFSKIRIPLSGGNALMPSALQSDAQVHRYDVFSIIQDKSGRLWFATVNGVYNYDGKSFTPFVVNEGGKGYMNPEKNNVEYIIEDNEGNLWFGGRVNDGVFRFDGESITNIALEELNGNTWAWPVLQDKSGNIWFSNWGGAYRYDGESFTTFTKDDGLCSDVVNRIIEDKEGNLWFGSGSKNGGLSRYDGKTFTCFTTKEGLINNDIWTILEDEKGNLWLGSREMGLCKYDGIFFTPFSERETLFSVGK